MALNAKVNKNTNMALGSLQFKEQQNFAGGTVQALSVSVPPAQTGTLTTRTDNTDGVITITGTNNIATGNRVDVYWAGGNVRHGMIVGTVAGQSVPISGGAGPNLPIATTLLQVCVAVEKVFTVIGNNIQVFGASMDTISGQAAGIIGVVDPVTSVPADAINAAAMQSGFARIQIDSAVPYDWEIPINVNSGPINPLAGVTVANVYLSHNDTANAHIMQVGVVAA